MTPPLMFALARYAEPFGSGYLLGGFIMRPGDALATWVPHGIRDHVNEGMRWLATYTIHESPWSRGEWWHSVGPCHRVEAWRQFERFVRIDEDGRRRRPESLDEAVPWFVDHMEEQCQWCATAMGPCEIPPAQSGRMPEETKR